MFNKLGLKTYDGVRLIKLSPDLDGRRGSIVGIATRHIVDCYIVPYQTKDFTDVAVSIPECCLERIP
jgi:hypothetical protein